MGFPGANEPRETSDYVLLGAPLDISTSFQPGTRFGPREVRHHAHPFDDYDRHTDQRFTELGVHDAGDLDGWADAAEYLDFLRGMVTDIHNEERLPLLVGGEHTVSAAGVRATDPDIYVCLDAHLDLREEYAGNELSHATVTRRVLDTVDEAVILGARTGSEEEWKRAERDDITVIPPSEVPDWDPDFDGTVYLSVDIDAADPAFAPGTGTMEPFGLAPRELRRVVRAVAPSTTGFDVVEVNDRDDGQAAALAGKLLREFVYTHAAQADE